MNHRCPLCGAKQAKQKFGQAMVARMNVECSRCGRAIRLNVHPVETAVVLLNFAIIVALALFAYHLQSRGLVLVAFGAAMIGAASLPLLERTYLRSWPRYLADTPPSKR